ncbi:TonB-dependent receptor [Mangrovimicrobium sediminis]|uniref:TonB-dependent receptor n=1 Tax=Mangrovimicrobium sediminis TaxID=2562682 RepID=UPI00143697E7|nr:TonB-dependent receptor [Haliea sp. SAOS-164]
MALPVVPGIAHAQADAGAQGGLEEVVVTARKRAERLEDIPVSITALSGEQIDNMDLTSLERVAAYTPQLVVTRAPFGSGASLTLRGIGSPFSSVGIEQSVAVIVDGAYYGQGRTINEGLFDARSVEVLKGPQALFFGKNATAGVISIQTADPGEELEFKARGGYEFELETVLGEMMVSGPLTDTLGARLAILGRKSNAGLSENLAEPVDAEFFDVATSQTNVYTFPGAARDQPKEEELFGRLTLKWDPSDDLSSTLKAYVSERSQGSMTANVIVQCPEPTFFSNPGIACPKDDYKTYQNALPAQIGNNFPYAKGSDLYEDYDSYAFNLNTDYDGIDRLSLNLVLNYQENDYEAIQEYFYENVVPGYATYKSTFDAYSAELRGLTQFDGPLNFLVGGYYQQTERHHQDIVLIAGLENTAEDRNRYVTFDKDSETDDDTLALYFQGIFELGDDIEITAGARYTDETKKSYFVQPYVNPAVTNVWVPDQFVRDDQSFSDWSPEATVSWKMTPDLMLYAAYKTGFKSGGFSNNSILTPTTPPGGLSFDEETAEGFEGGLKATLLDRQLSLNVIAYRYEYEDLQLDFYNAANVSFVTTNAGSAVTEGIEFEATYAPNALPGLNLHGTLNYNSAEYEEFLGPCYIGQTAAAGCVLTGPGGAPFQDLGGQALANAPEWTASAAVAYDWELGAGRSLALLVQAKYVDDYYASGFGSPLSQRDSYYRVDASARLRLDNDAWEVAVIGKNLTDEFIVTGAYDITGTGFGTGEAQGRLADQASSVDLPRTVQVELTYRY